MSTQPNNAAETAQVLAGRLEKLGVEYAIGGALALGFWGEPRGMSEQDNRHTNDQDNRWGSLARMTIAA